MHLWPPRFLLFLEVKSPRGRLTQAQERFIVYFPGYVHVVTSVEQALEAVGVHSVRRESPDMEREPAARPQLTRRAEG